MPFYYKISDPKEAYLASELNCIVPKKLQQGGPYRSSHVEKIDVLYYNKIVIDEVKELKFLLQGLELVCSSELSAEFLSEVGKVIESREVTRAEYIFNLTPQKGDSVNNMLAILQFLVNPVVVLYGRPDRYARYDYPMVPVNINNDGINGLAKGNLREILAFHQRLPEYFVRKSQSLKFLK